MTNPVDFDAADLADAILGPDPGAPKPDPATPDPTPPDPAPSLLDRPRNPRGRMLGWALLVALIAAVSIAISLAVQLAPDDGRPERPEWREIPEECEGLFDAEAEFADADC